MNGERRTDTPHTTNQNWSSAAVPREEPTKIAIIQRYGWAWASMECSCSPFSVFFSSCFSFIYLIFFASFWVRWRQRTVPTQWSGDSVERILFSFQIIIKWILEISIHHAAILPNPKKKNSKTGQFLWLQTLNFRALNWLATKWWATAASWWWNIVIFEYGLLRRVQKHI